MSSNWRLSTLRKIVFILYNTKDAFTIYWRCFCKSWSVIRKKSKRSWCDDWIIFDTSTLNRSILCFCSLCFDIRSTWCVWIRWFTSSWTFETCWRIVCCWLSSDEGILIASIMNWKRWSKEDFWSRKTFATSDGLKESTSLGQHFVNWIRKSNSEKAMKTEVNLNRRMMKHFQCWQGFLVSASEMQITLSVLWKEQLSRNLRVAVTQLPKMREFFQEACEIVSEKSDAIFSAGGSNVQKSPKRKQLSPATVKARQKWWWYYKNRPNNPWILRWTWKMQESKKIKVSDSSGILEFTDEKAMFHQQGGWRLPQRAVLDLDNDTNTKIVKAMQQKIENDLGVFWLQV